MNRFWKYTVISLIALVLAVSGGFYLYELKKTSDPGYYIMHQKMGLSYLRQGLLDQAVEEFEKAAEARPESVEAHYGLGIAYFRKRDMEKAVSSYQKALRLAPDRPDIRYSLGLVYQEMGNYKEALEEYDHLLEKDPRAYEAYNNIGIIQANMGNYEKAIRSLKEAVGIMPDYYPARINLARAYEIQGRPDLASREYEYIQKRASKGPETQDLVRLAERRLAALKASKDKGK